MILDNARYSVSGKLLNTLMDLLPESMQDNADKVVEEDAKRIIGCLVWTEEDISEEQVKDKDELIAVLDFLEDYEGMLQGVESVNEDLDAAIVWAQSQLDRNGGKQ